jgi:hypothetical protein
MWLPIIKYLIVRRGEDLGMKKAPLKAGNKIIRLVIKSNNVYFLAMLKKMENPL